MARLLRRPSALLSLLITLLSGMLAGCSHTVQAPPNSPIAEANLVRSLSLQWAQAINAKDLEKTLSYYAPDAAAYPPNAPVAETPDQRRSFWTKTLAIPGYRIDLTASSVEAALSGELAVETGFFMLSSEGKDGKTSASRGKYVSVWRKQPDGAWKIYHNIWNLDQ